MKKGAHMAGLCSILGNDREQPFRECAPNTPTLSTAKLQDGLVFSIHFSPSQKLQILISTFLHSYKNVGAQYFHFYLTKRYAGRYVYKVLYIYCLM